MLGMVVDDPRPGYARLSIPVREDMLNGHGSCHGGMIFTLANSAFTHTGDTRNHVNVDLADGSCVALFRGKSRAIGGAIVDHPVQAPS